MSEPEAVPQESSTEAPASSSERQPVRAWAEKSGHLPEALPGTRMRPARFNRKSWLMRAACAHLKLTLDDLTDERTYLDAVAAVSAVGAR